MEHAVMLQKWASRTAECRVNVKSVKNLCSTYMAYLANNYLFFVLLVGVMHYKY